MGGDLLAMIFWLKSDKLETYSRKQVVAVGGDPMHRRSLSLRKPQVAQWLFCLTMSAIRSPNL
jgi:hypothetical protein